jgi:glycosyltransferase involved in cell wall biosynthesis
MRLAIVQRVVKGYRVPVFGVLSEKINVSFFYGADIPNSKSTSSRLDQVVARYCKTSHFYFFGRTWTVHWDLIRQLRKFNPDCILVEGESHLFGVLFTLVYKLLYNRKVPLMKWCFIDLPDGERHGLRYIVKRVFNKAFNSFILYSSFSAGCLERYGIDLRNGFVTVNVGDTERLLSLCSEWNSKKHLIREEFGLTNKFTVLYIGNFAPQKNFERFLAVASKCSDSDIAFIVVGDDKDLKSYQKQVSLDPSLEAVKFLGKRSDIEKVYISADVVYIPGRGGMVISEAMSFGRPVIVHNADGTEYDLVKDGVTGYHFDYNIDLVIEKLEFLKNNTEAINKMGANARNLIKQTYNTRNMADVILKAAETSINRSHK